MSKIHADPRWGSLAAKVLAQGRRDDAPCCRCGGPINYGAPANHPAGPTVDHLVPMGLGGELLTDHLGMAHRSCNSRHGARVGNILRGKRTPTAATPDYVPTGRDSGPGAAPEQFQVPWLEGLLDPGESGTWPRVMSPPHPRAVGTLGWAVVERVEARRETDPMVPKKQKRLRWWQKLLIVRMYEVDAEDRLVWSAVVLSTSRQVGKSVVLREIALDRISQHEHYGEAQLVLHVAKDLTIADEIQRPARQWAAFMEEQGEPWHPIGNNGRWAVEHCGVMGRWLIRSQSAVYGFSASTALVDEAWAIDVGPVSEGLEPTMAEREQPQLLLVSTAHSKATPLMPAWRARAMDELEQPDQILVLEWSAPPEAVADPGQVQYHRMASPYWSPQRAAFVAARVNEEGFTEQWLNIWPPGAGAVETLVIPEVWRGLAVQDLKIPRGATSGRTLVVYPDINQASWHVLEAGAGPDDRVALAVIGRYSNIKGALTRAAAAAREAPADLIVPRHLRTRVPRLPGIRNLVLANESDLAAAATTVRPMLQSGQVSHDGSPLLGDQITRAVLDRYGETIRITAKGSGTSVELAKAAVLAVWWAARADRPRAVVV